MERTSSQNRFWPEWSCSWIRAAQFSHFGRPKRGILESCVRKKVRARLGPCYSNWPEQVLFGRTERTNGTRPKLKLLIVLFDLNTVQKALNRELKRLRMRTSAKTAAEILTSSFSFYCSYNSLLSFIFCM